VSGPACAGAAIKKALPTHEVAGIFICRDDAVHGTSLPIS
jgi:hypothetical protein